MEEGQNNRDPDGVNKAGRRGIDAIHHYRRYIHIGRYRQMKTRTKVETTRTVLVTVEFWRGKNTYPYTLEYAKKHKIPGKKESFEVPIEETYIKDGKRYYKYIWGHGQWEIIPIE
jgi:hypothetical protein